MTKFDKYIVSLKTVTTPSRNQWSVSHHPASISAGKPYFSSNQETDSLGKTKKYSFAPSNQHDCDDEDRPEEFFQLSPCQLLVYLPSCNHTKMSAWGWIGSCSRKYKCDTVKWDKNPGLLWWYSLKTAFTKYSFERMESTQLTFQFPLSSQHCSCVKLQLC